MNDRILSIMEELGKEVSELYAAKSGLSSLTEPEFVVGQKVFVRSQANSGWNDNTKFNIYKDTTLDDAIKEERVKSIMYSLASDSDTYGSGCHRTDGMVITYAVGYDKCRLFAKDIAKTREEAVERWKGEYDGIMKAHKDREADDKRRKEEEAKRILGIN